MSNQAINLKANASTIVKEGPGRLGFININKIGATGNTLAIYDGLDTSGTITPTVLLGTIDTTVAAAPTRIYDVVFQQGLLIVIASGTAADVTVCFS